MPTLTLPDGARIAYDEHDHTDPWTRTDTVVLVHGFSKNRRYWFEWIPDLSRRYRVICPDQRGHGDSSLPPRDFRMSMRPFADDLAALLDALNIPRAHFVCAEYTAAVAVELATAHPDRVASLVLPGFGINGVASRVDWDGWAGTAEREGAEAWARQTNHLRLSDDADPAFREWYVTQQARMPGWLLAKVFRYAKSMDLTGNLSAVRAPTLVITGSASKHDTPQSVERAVASMPHGRCVVLEGAPFNVMSARAGECVALTAAFLRGHGCQ